MMQVQLKLTKWQIKTDKETKQPRIEGSYAIMMGDQEIATNDFNGEYGSNKKFAFTGELVQEVMALEAKIKNQIQSFLN